MMGLRVETWEVVKEIPMPESVNARVRAVLERRDGYTVTITGNLMCFDKQHLRYEVRHEYFTFTLDDVQAGNIEMRTKVEFR